ncbi:MAG: hypothetical protein V2I56_17835 [Desulfobacteraceae bacterium]|nr:hypothetical protein [Desulfobacteraceae bacterium]
MTRKTSIVHRIYLLMVLFIMLWTTSCGTIIYPERHGQSPGKVDVGVAVLDGIGLLFFLVPGVIAFGVDFATGAIYLPPSSSANLEINPSNLQDAKIIMAEAESLTHDAIEAVVQKETRQDIDLTAPKTVVARVLPNEPLVWGNINDTLTPNQLYAFANN